MWQVLAIRCVKYTRATAVPAPPHIGASPSSVFCLAKGLDPAENVVIMSSFEECCNIFACLPPFYRHLLTQDNFVQKLRPESAVKPRDYKSLTASDFG